MRLRRLGPTRLRFDIRARRRGVRVPHACAALTRSVQPRPPIARLEEVVQSRTQIVQELADEYAPTWIRRLIHQQTSDEPVALAPDLRGCIWRSLVVGPALALKQVQVLLGSVELEANACER